MATVGLEQCKEVQEICFPRNTPLLNYASVPRNNNSVRYLEIEQGGRADIVSLFWGMGGGAEMTLIRL